MSNPRVLICTTDNHECQQFITAAETLGCYSLAVRTALDLRNQMRLFKPDAVLINSNVIQINLLDFLLSLPGKRTVFIGLITGDQQVKDWISQSNPKRIRILDIPVATNTLQSFIRQVIKSEERKPHRRALFPKQFELLVGSSQPMEELYTQIAKVAPTDATILICGQSGTGKELVARSIHNRSARCDKRFLAINCGAIPDSLIESELFGCEKGSYTGADKMRKGVFERANHGTLFLDEITEMAMEAQIRLLRVLEERAVTRIGGDHSIKFDVRVIAATNRDPIKAIADGQLREDLHYRLAVFPIIIPPLAKRSEDVIMLANHFLTELNKSNDADKRLSEVGIKRLLAYDWPGNVRQLRNIIYRDFILENKVLNMQSLLPLIENGNDAASTQSMTQPSVSPAAIISSGTRTDNDEDCSDSLEATDNEPPSTMDDPDSVTIQLGTTLEQADRQLILCTLQQCDNNKTLAARKLGISLKTLYNKLQKYEEQDVEVDKNEI